MTFFAGCGPSSLSDISLEASTHRKKLMKILDKVQSKQDLIDHSSKIKKEINAFTDLMILAKEMEGEENQRMVSAEDEILSSELKEAMKRVYQIEGARELFENLQRDALHRLDYVLYQAKKEKSNS
jgi:hypothetical protein